MTHRTEAWQLAAASKGVAAFVRRHGWLYRLAGERLEHYLAPAFLRVRALADAGRLDDLDPTHARRLAVRAARLGCVDDARNATGVRTQKGRWRQSVVSRADPEQETFVADGSMSHWRVQLKNGSQTACPVARRQMRAARAAARAADYAGDLIRVLSRVESVVVEQFFGLGAADGRGLTLKAIAAGLGLSETRGSQILAEAMKRLGRQTARRLEHS